jgi:hypothetical protein
MKAVAYSLVLGAAAVILGLSSGQAIASDQKVEHPLSCVPLSPQTTFSDLYYRPVGVKNIRATTEYVVCGVTVDIDSGSYWSLIGGTASTLAVTFHTPNAGTAECEVSVGSNLDGTKATFSGSHSFTANEVSNVVISSIHGDAVTQNFMANYPVSLYCALPPEASILRVRLNESGNTDSPSI